MNDTYLNLCESYSEWLVLVLEIDVPKSQSTPEKKMFLLNIGHRKHNSIFLCTCTRMLAFNTECVSIVHSRLSTSE